MSAYNAILGKFRDEMVKQIKEQQQVRERAKDHQRMLQIISKAAGRSGDGEWMTETFKRTDWQERLYRYAHNLNIEKVEKWDRKLNELYMVQMEDCRENPEKYVWVEDKGKTKTNENAYLSVCDEAKYHYEDRAKIIKLVRMLIAVKPEA